MAFDASQDQAQDPEQLKNQANQSAGQPNTQLSGGGGGFAGQGASPQAGGAAGAPGSNNQQPTSSGNWTNLSSYLTANADQAPSLGQSVANTVQSQATQAQGDLGQVQQGFQKQAPYQQLNNTTTNDVDQAFSDPSQYSGANAQSTATPESYLNNGWGINSTNNNIGQYGATTTNPDGSTTSPTVSGPTWNSVVGDYQKAGQTLQDSQSESGRGVLLQNQFGQNGTNYSQGEQNFDQLLLQQNTQNQSALNSVYNQYAPSILAGTSTANNPSGMPLDLYNAAQTANSYVTAEQGKASGFQTEAQKDLGAQITSLGTSVSGEADTANKGYGATAGQLSTDLTNRQLTPAEIQALGLPPGSIDLYGVDPSQFLNAPAANPYTANSAATTQDWNNYGGLQALVGGEAGSDQAAQLAALGKLGLTGDQASQAGAPPVASPLSGFQTQNFLTAIQNAGDTYNKGIAKDQSALEQARTSILADPTVASAYGISPPTQGSLSDLVNYFTTFGQSPQAQLFKQNSPLWPQIQGAINDYDTLQKENSYLDAGANASPSNPQGIAPISTPTSVTPSGAPVGPKTPVETSPVGAIPTLQTHGPQGRGPAGINPIPKSVRR